MSAAERTPLGEAWTLDSVLKLRDEIQAGDAATAARDERLHGAAALLSSFEITPIHTGVAAANLIADCVPLEDASHRWTLKNSVRRRVLQQLYTREALQSALQQTSDRPDDPLQHAIEACLTGSMKSLLEQTAEELAASMQVVDWLGVTDLKESLPAIDAVRQQVEYAALLDPLRALAGSNFHGRKTELATLAKYVEPDEAVNGSERPPLLIFGPGGMGKSSLIAKFVLDRIGQLPIVYLDCDRPGLAPQEPVTFLAEAVRQLGLQFDKFRSPAENLRTEWLRSITLAQTDNANTRGRTGALDEFRVFVNDLGLAQSTVLFAIDTFEEVQYRSRTVAYEVALFLSELRQRLPLLRTVIAGRNPAPEFAVMPLELGELDQEASQGLLASLGVKSPELLARLARLLHGNPLSLRLAAEIIEAGDSKGWSDIEGLTDDTKIQGVLYGRILGHIHLGDVRKIAHPGLILRRITADLIRDVLAGPCEVRMDDPKYADTLFSLLRNELSLVIPEVGAVRHRSDVRRVMLEPLRNDRKEVVRRIEEAAVTYYTPFDDLTSRAEEIYHRLSLGQSAETIDSRWLPGIEDSLRSALEELPKPAARAYLANRLRVELYDQDWDAVDQKNWEDYAARQSEDLLKLDRPLGAVRLLRRRAARLPGSPLYWLQAQALRRGGQVLESREIARQAIEQIVAAGSRISVPLLDWFTGPELRAAPSAEEVQRQLAQVEILLPLRTLAGASFVGREQELAGIGVYVLSRGPVPRAPLLIYGPGGIGKSALIAKFILNRLGDLDPIYIDWDAIEGTVASPPGALDRLWGEMYRQVCLMRPELRFDTSGDRPIDSERLRLCFERMRDITRPLLLVIDGLEGLQLQHGSEVERLFAVLEDLERAAPRLRVVLVSRLRPTGPNFETLELAGLASEAADALVASLGIEPIEARRSVLAVAGTSPLRLKLAAEVVRQSGVESLEGVSSEAGIAPVLLERILDHIPNNEVRTLARGALALRRLTAEVIKDVLAGPFQLAVDSARAHDWLEALARETSLFAEVGPGVVRSRPDVRQILRKSLAPSDAVVRAIDEAAVAYYQTRREPELRAEEIFHRIMLGQTPEEIDGRWMDGVEPFLQDVALEVPGPVRGYLGVRLGLDVDFDPATADQATWEVYVVKRVNALMEIGQVPAALDLVRQRSTRMRRSPLYAVETRILLSLERPREALVVGRRGLELWPDDTTLAEVVADAERELGPGETAEHDESKPPGAYYQLYDDVDADGVLEVLRVALPTSTDATNAFRALHGLPGNLPIDNLESLVSWASSAERLAELMTAAAAYAPANPSLRDFLAKHARRVELFVADPMTRVLLQNGEVFLNRQVLRDFLRGLVAGEVRSRVLVVNGPSGSGKSYTGVLADSVARAIVLLEYRRVELSAEQDGFALIRRVFDAFQWRSDLIAPPSADARVQYFHTIANIIRRKAQESRATLLLHVDIGREPPSETVDFVRMLIEQPGQLALILSGFSEDWIPARAHRLVLFEDLSDLSIQDIEDGIAVTVRGSKDPHSPGEIAHLAQGVLEDAGSGDHFNLRVNSRMKALLSTLRA